MTSQGEDERPQAIHSQVSRFSDSLERLAFEERLSSTSSQKKRVLIPFLLIIYWPGEISLALWMARDSTWMQVFSILIFLCLSFSSLPNLECISFYISLNIFWKLCVMTWSEATRRRTRTHWKCRDFLLCWRWQELGTLVLMELDLRSQQDSALGWNELGPALSATLPAERRSSTLKGEKGPGADVTGLAGFARGSGFGAGVTDVVDGEGKPPRPGARRCLDRAPLRLGAASPRPLLASLPVALPPPSPSSLSFPRSLPPFVLSLLLLPLHLRPGSTARSSVPCSWPHSSLKTLTPLAEPKPGGMFPTQKVGVYGSSHFRFRKCTWRMPSLKLVHSVWWRCSLAERLMRLCVLNCSSDQHNKNRAVVGDILQDGWNIHRTSAILSGTLAGLINIMYFFIIK